MPLFIADSMLGTLAKWLRFFGYDTLYIKNIKDEEIVKLAKEERRIILTRDKKLKNAIYIKSDKLEEQLKQLIKELNLNFKNALERCSICNSLLKEVKKEEVKGEVADGVYLRQNKFWKCENCNKFYWKGTHYRNIIKKIGRFKIY